MGNKTIVFKPSGGHQTWDNGYPPTPDKTEDYPYQAIVFLDTIVTKHVSLVVSKVPMEIYYVSGNTYIRLRAIDFSNIKIYLFNNKNTIPTSWNSADVISEVNDIAFGQSDGNHQFNYGVAGYVGDIYVSYSATIDQIYDYDALPTPFRMRNLRHYDSSFLRSKSAKVKITEGEWMRCNI